MSDPRAPLPDVSVDLQHLLADAADEYGARGVYLTVIALWPAAVPNQAGPLAQLFYTWEELDALARLVEKDLGDRYSWASGRGDEYVPPSTASFSLLNSLRTSLREAQETVVGRRSED